MNRGALITQLLDAQADLSAVERFAQRHAQDAEPALSGHYRELVPLSAPGHGEQYAFDVDLDACTGCKACVTACHSLNGLDPGEAWRRVGTLVAETPAGAVLQTLTMACHHCADPGCLRGCPVRAYEKDPATGIVRHLDDQCIGCSYCVMMCPYDVPQYSPSRGIVRKCDMCHGRLAAGEAPACVQACPSRAISIRVVPVEAAPTMRLTGAPEPALTRPTTRYHSRRGVLERHRAVDAERAVPAEAHAPLVAMLVATQFAVGLVGAALVATRVVPETAWMLAVAAAGTLYAGLAASVLHLGRPAKAWRAFLGLRTSWLSREIVAFGAMAAIMPAYLAVTWLVGPGAGASLVLGVAGVAAGLAATGCSAMLYQATGRTLWNGWANAGQFFGTALVLGAAGLGLVARGPGLGAVCVAIVAAVTLAKLAGLGVLVGMRGAASPLVRTGTLLRSQLSVVTGMRVAAGIFGGVVLPGLALAAGNGAVAGLAFVLSLAGETAERVLFFRAVSPARLPGSL